MYTDSAKPFLEGMDIAANLSSAIRQMMLMGAVKEGSHLDPGTRAVLQGRLDAAAAFYDGLNATATADSTRRVKEFLGQNVLARDADHAIQALRGTFIDELARWSVIILSPTEARMFDHGEVEIFGQEVVEAFPSAVPHMIEACKCFALGRWSASAYHCLGVVEIGIKALCRDVEASVNLDSFDTTWERMRKSIEAELTPTRDPNNPGSWLPARRKASHPETWGPDEAFYFSVLDDLKAIQRAYRNPTMHFRTVEPLDERQAKRVLDSVAGFVQDLATKVKE